MPFDEIYLYTDFDSVPEGMEEAVCKTCGVGLENREKHFIIQCIECYMKKMVKDDFDIAQAFTKLYYDRQMDVWQKTFWNGRKVLQCVADLWNFQELIHSRKPDLIIETGTAEGGCAQYFADLMDTMGIEGHVVTIDIPDSDYKPDPPLTHEKIVSLKGSSISEKIVRKVYEFAQYAREPMVFLDSCHTREHVTEELRLYHHLIPKGGWLVVEDSNTVEVNAALKAFLENHPEFVAEPVEKKFMVTFHPGGYLRRKGE